MSKYKPEILKTTELLNLREIYKKPFLLFSPFLVLSVILVLIFHDQNLVGDESKYLRHAVNIIHGYFSPPAPNIYLGVGPGYPLILVPFVGLKIPLIGIPLLNTIFYYLSIILIYKTLQEIVPLRLAVGVSLFWAFYYTLYENLLHISPELVAPFLISAFIYFLVKLNKSTNIFSNKYIYFAGFTFGFLAMTKIIFGYVLLFMLVGNGLIWLFHRSSINYAKGFFVLLFALITTLPYLAYTYQLTGKVYYWGTTAGNNMYWMSTPFEKEYGSWFPEPKQVNDSAFNSKSYTDFRRYEYKVLINDEHYIPGTLDYIWYNHHKDFEKVNKLAGVELDNTFKRLAFENIRTNPIKYLKNCFSNLGRMLFNYPYSYKYQNPGTLLRIPPNGIILALLLFCLFPTIINWKEIIFPIRFAIFLFLLYLGGSLTGSAEIRMFSVTVPILLLWISFILNRTLKINWRFEEK